MQSEHFEVKIFGFVEEVIFDLLAIGSLFYGDH